MNARPLIYVSDLERAVAFYSLFGLAPHNRRQGNLIELRGENLTIALHRTESLPATEPKPRVLLTFEADRPLPELADELRRAGVEFERHIPDEAYGYSMAVRDPDGLLIQINQHDIDS